MPVDAESQRPSHVPRKFVDDYFLLIAFVVALTANAVVFIASQRWWCFFACRFASVQCSNGISYTYGLVPTAILSLPGVVSGSNFAPDMCELSCTKYFKVSDVVGESKDISEDCRIIRFAEKVHPNAFKRWKYPDVDIYTCKSRPHSNKFSTTSTTLSTKVSETDSEDVTNASTPWHVKIPTDIFRTDSKDTFTSGNSVPTDSKRLTKVLPEVIRTTATPIDSKDDTRTSKDSFTTGRSTVAPRVDSGKVPKTFEGTITTGSSFLITGPPFKPLIASDTSEKGRPKRRISSTYFEDEVLPPNWWGRRWLKEIGPKFLLPWTNIGPEYTPPTPVPNAGPKLLPPSPINIQPSLQPPDVSCISDNSIIEQINGSCPRFHRLEPESKPPTLIPKFV